jgi:hypothetical protein
METVSASRSFSFLFQKLCTKAKEVVIFDLLLIHPYKASTNVIDLGPVTQWPNIFS